MVVFDSKICPRLAAGWLHRVRAGVQVNPRGEPGLPAHPEEGFLGAVSYSRELSSEGRLAELQAQWPPGRKPAGLRSKQTRPKYRSEGRTVCGSCSSGGPVDGCVTGSASSGWGLVQRPQLWQRGAPPFPTQRSQSLSHRRPGPSPSVCLALSLSQAAPAAGPLCMLSPPPGTPAP